MTPPISMEAGGPASRLFSHSAEPERRDCAFP